MSGLKPITVNTPTEDEAHIYAEDDAAIYQSLFGEDGVSSVGQACKATVLSNNKVRVADGVICVGGHFARIPYGDYIDCEIENGQSGQNRNDIIVARFETTGTGGIDTYTCEVKKGMAGSTATDPEIVQEDLYKAGKVRELPLYRVKIEGLSITAVEQLFTLRKTNEELEKELVSLNSKIKNFNTDKTLWSGSVINKDVELSDSIYNFRWIYIETEDGIVSPILIRKDKNTYLTGYGYASSPIEIITVGIKLTINTATNINILSQYVAHRFNSTHPDLSAKRVTAIYGVPTYS